MCFPRCASVAKLKLSRRDYVLRDGSKFLLRKLDFKLELGEFVNSSRKYSRVEKEKEKQKSIYATSIVVGRSLVATCGNPHISLGWIADKSGKKEIRNLVSLDYWFVSGIYAESFMLKNAF